MNKSKFVFALVTLTIAFLLITGCGRQKYVQIGQSGGTTLELDSESVVYNKEKDVANYLIKTTFTEPAKRSRAAAWSKEGVNPFVAVEYLLVQQEMKITQRAFRATEFAFFDKNDKLIRKDPVPSNAHWAAINDEMTEKLYQEVIKKIQ
jgi:hypothetical protein